MFRILWVLSAGRTSNVSKRCKNKCQSSVGFCEALGRDHCHHKCVKQLIHSLAGVWTTVLLTVVLDTTHTVSVGCVYCPYTLSRKAVTTFPPTLTISDPWKLSCCGPPHLSTEAPALRPRVLIPSSQLLCWHIWTLPQMWTQHLQGPCGICWSCWSSLFRAADSCPLHHPSMSNYTHLFTTYKFTGL